MIVQHSLQNFHILLLDLVKQLNGDIGWFYCAIRLNIH